MPAAAISTASGKVRVPSRSMTLARCISTVRELTPSCLPIVLFVPRASNPSKTCGSRADIPAMRRSADSLSRCSLVVCWMLAIASHDQEIRFAVARVRDQRRRHVIVPALGMVQDGLDAVPLEVADGVLAELRRRSASMHRPRPTVTLCVWCRYGIASANARVDSRLPFHAMRM
jgi:hypothetical protein